MMPTMPIFDPDALPTIAETAAVENMASVLDRTFEAIARTPDLPDLVPYKPVGGPEPSARRLYDIQFERECAATFWKFRRDDGFINFSFDLAVHGSRVMGLPEHEALAASMADAIAQLERALPTMRAVAAKMKEEGCKPVGE